MNEEGIRTLATAAFRKGWCAYWVQGSPRIRRGEPDARTRGVLTLVSKRLKSGVAFKVPHAGGQLLGVVVGGHLFMNGYAHHNASQTDFKAEVFERCQARWPLGLGCPSRPRAKGADGIAIGRLILPLTTWKTEVPCLLGPKSGATIRVSKLGGTGAGGKLNRSLKSDLAWFTSPKTLNFWVNGKSSLKENGRRKDLSG